VDTSAYIQQIANYLQFVKFIYTLCQVLINEIVPRVILTPIEIPEPIQGKRVEKFKKTLELELL